MTDTVDEVPKPELKDTISQTAPTEGGAQPEGDTSTASSPSQEREDVADNKDGAGLSSRACTTGKGKGLRQEKTTGGGVGRSSGRTPSTSFDLGTGSSKKTGTLQPGAAQSYALEPDPKGNERAQAMAEGYLGRVKVLLYFISVFLVCLDVTEKNFVDLVATLNSIIFVSLLSGKNYAIEQHFGA